MIYIMHKDITVTNEQISNNIAFDCMQQYGSVSTRYNLINLIDRFVSILYLADEISEPAIQQSKFEIQQSFQNTFNQNNINYFEIIDSLNINYMNSINKDGTDVDYFISELKSKLYTSPKFIQFILKYIYDSNKESNVAFVVNNENTIRIISNIHTPNEINNLYRIVRISKTNNINKISMNNFGFKKSNDPLINTYDYILAISEDITINTIRLKSKFIKLNKER